ncbi:amino acid adenylation domain-containing protein [Saccharospirillum alexandrii]|uniref:amino acid adenylation domain-containing protein n=1 Tax=Saccharospirillum alexandrii TaxID=2448477 RepID=UPI00373649E2
MTQLVQDYFTASARRFPDKIAVRCADQSISYQALDQATNRLARHLSGCGVPAQSMVAFFMPKSLESMHCILGILKADCTYVPIDVNSPAQRLQSILKSLDSQVILVSDASEALLRERLPEDAGIEIINVNQLADASLSSEPVACTNLSIDLAYVLFTSGSTGVPKGVMIPHKAIVDYIDWCVETYELTDQDEIANHAPLYFDNSTFDLYTAFKTGATLHLVDDALNAVLPRLIRWLDEHAITTFFCVPSVLTLLLKSRRLKPEAFRQVRHILCAGEALPPTVVRQWMLMYPHIQFTNMYGPTEITVDCTYHVIDKVPAADARSIPIGKPRRNMDIWVRTELGELTRTPGAQGELLVRGTSVAYGYLGLAEKSAEVFIQNPWHERFHDPLYCTGDLVQIDDAGLLHYLGRLDDQIKYLGYRIELGEIEAGLNSLDAIEEAVVVFSPEQEGEEPFIAALVHADPTVSQTDLIDAMKARLPGYMVPTRIERTDQPFPRTPNGKYDRKTILKRFVTTEAA